MNELIVSSITTKRMSSLEVAGLVEKRHDNVKRTIETLVNAGVLVQPQIEDEQFTDSVGRERTTKIYLLDKRSSLIVVAQLSPEFTARIVDRWQELEEQQTLQMPETAHTRRRNPLLPGQLVQGRTKVQ